MAVVLGLLVAVAYGTGDFFGGLAAKRTAALSVMVGSFAISAVVLAAVTAGWAIVATLPSPTTGDLVLSVAAGCVGPVALWFLYHGLATGRMSVVAPITAVVAAAVPFAWGLARGERPSTVAIGGVALALVAVGLISGAPAHAAAPDGEGSRAAAGDGGGQDHGRPALVSSRASVPGAVASGLGFGIIFVLFGSTSDDAGLWPILVARMVSVTATVVAVTAWSRTRRAGGAGTSLRPAGAWGLVAVAGVFDLTANALYLAATRRGLLSIVAVLSSLYPASTVVLARVVLRERLHLVQFAGLLLAAVGVAAMAAS